jgi:hypothetical protein
LAVHVCSRRKHRKIIGIIKLLVLSCDHHRKSVIAMDPLRNAILLNNTGVEQLDFGHIDGALYSFQCAVASVKVATAMSTACDGRAFHVFSNEKPTLSSHTVRRFPPTFTTTYNDELSSRQVGKRSANDSTTVPNSSPSSTTSHPRGVLLSGLNSGLSYIYNRPLLIPTDITIQNLDHMNSVVVTSSIYIIFNFALACHLVGKCSGKENYMIRAVRLYELTLKVLDTAQHQRDNCYQHEILSVLECLTLNNLAQIHYEQCNYKLSQFYMDNMYELLMNVQCMDAYLDENELEEMMLNLVYLQSPPVAKAA